jgi:hypothetical protein
MTRITQEHFNKIIQAQNEPKLPFKCEDTQVKVKSQKRKNKTSHVSNIKELIPKECEEQVVLFRWAELNKNKYPFIELMFSIPNGGSRNIIEAVHLQQQGVKPGVPDVFLPVANGVYHGLFIEMKRIKGGVLSDKQDEYIIKLKQQFYRVDICKGADEAIRVIKDYYGEAT